MAADSNRKTQQATEAILRKKPDIRFQELEKMDSERHRNDNGSKRSARQRFGAPPEALHTGHPRPTASGKQSKAEIISAFFNARFVI